MAALLEHLHHVVRRPCRLVVVKGDRVVVHREVVPCPRQTVALETDFLHPFALALPVIELLRDPGRRVQAMPAPISCVAFWPAVAEPLQDCLESGRRTAGMTVRDRLPFARPPLESLRRKGLHRTMLSRSSITIRPAGRQRKTSSRSRTGSVTSSRPTVEHDRHRMGNGCGRPDADDATADPMKRSVSRARVRSLRRTARVPALQSRVFGVVSRTQVHAATVEGIPMMLAAEATTWFSSSRETPSASALRVPE